MSRMEPTANGNRQITHAIQVTVADVLAAVLTSCEETANAVRI